MKIRLESWNVGNGKFDFYQKSKTLRKIDSSKFRNRIPLIDQTKRVKIMLGNNNKSLGVPTNPTTTTAPSTIYGINDLPVEIRGKIFNLLPQNEATRLRLVSEQWKSEIDDLYEFTWTVYDNYDNELFEPFPNLCKECTIWKLTFPNIELQPDFQLLKYPAYLKILNIFGPVKSELLQRIVTSAINLEKLKFSRRANFPYVLTLKNTPELANLKHLKEISYASDSRSMTGISSDFPFLDCYFPKLEKLDFVLLGLIPPIDLLRFLSNHAPTLKSLNLSQRILPLHPLLLKDSNPLSLEPKHLESLKLLRNLVYFNVLTNDWTVHWAQILSQQSKLQELSFETWTTQNAYLEDGDEAEEEILNEAPWCDFELPIKNSSLTLNTVELYNLSMVFDGKIRPFDLAIFKFCNGLETLTLRCNEGHGQNGDDPETEVLLMINANDLPSSLLYLAIKNIPMLSSDLKIMADNLTNLTTLFLGGVGKTGRLGVISSVLHATSFLTKLKYLDIVEFNTSDPLEYEHFSILFEALQVRFNGPDTWLELDDGAIPAHVKLEVIKGVELNR